MTSEYKKLDAAKICDILLEMSKKSESLLIFSHQNPDGDTVGSAFALKQICSQLNIRAKCVCCGDGAPYLHNFYWKQDTIAYSPGEEHNFDFLCAVDVASPKQLGFLAKLSGKFRFMIDHHKSGEPFADYFICPDASACGELIYEIYALLTERGAAEHDPQTARCLYAAISSDTGSFKYSNTTGKTHMIAAALADEINNACDGGSDCAEIARILHDSRTVGELRAEKLAIENLRFACGGKLAYLVFTADMMEQNSLTELDLGGLVDLPRSIEGVSVGLTIKQSRSDPRSFRLSSRSNAGVNVAEICKSFGGGGHDKAAGASLEADSPQKAEEIIIPKFAAALEAEAARDSGNRKQS